MNTPNHIRVWAWDDAPEELKELSRNGGDEDWVALIPPKHSGIYARWLDTPAFGCCCVDEHTHPELPGYTVRIGCHS